TMPLKGSRRRRLFTEFGREGLATSIFPKIFEVSVFDSYSGELRRLRGLCRWRRWSLGCRSEAGTCSSESGDEPQDIQRDLESVTWITVRAATRYLLFVDKLS